MNFYPGNTEVVNFEAARGFFSGHFPSGVVIHYTAGASWKSTASYLKSKGLGYHFMIDRGGEVIQGVPLEQYCHHAGKSVWKDVKSINRHFCGIALCNFGLLERKQNTLFNAYGSPVGNDCPSHTFNGEHWEAVRFPQMISLLRLCSWLVKQGISIETIVGHNEIAPKRKVDPGYILGMSMQEFREYLRFTSDLYG